jgi:hypothetical protein
MAYQHKPIPLAKGFKLRNGQLIGPPGSPTIANKTTKAKNVGPVPVHDGMGHHTATSRGADVTTPHGPAKTGAVYTHDGMTHVHAPGVIAQGFSKTEMQRHDTGQCVVTPRKP